MTQALVLPWTEDLAASMALALLRWFERCRRALPWREDYSPYGVWISEVMLQQTQMERGVTYWRRWMDRFPDVAAVAAASEESVLQAWEGLGYYRRARFVHRAAKAMCELHGGEIPQDPAQLAALPGLGAYTVAAIRSIAFQHDVTVVDANVERVFSRLLNLDQSPKKPEAALRIRQAADRLLPPGRARDYNQALMELGALICAKAPLCPHCPLEEFCGSRRLGLETMRPVREEAVSRVDVLTAHGVLTHKGRVLLRRRPDAGVWGGLWEFPGGEAERGESPADALLRIFERQWGLNLIVERDLGVVKHAYTNHRLTAHFFRVRLAPPADLPAALRGALASGGDLRMVDCAAENTANTGEAGKAGALGDVPMPSHHRKMASRLFRSGSGTDSQSGRNLLTLVP